MVFFYLVSCKKENRYARSIVGKWSIQVSYQGLYSDFNSFIEFNKDYSFKMENEILICDTGLCYLDTFLTHGKWTFDKGAENLYLVSHDGVSWICEIQEYKKDYMKFSVRNFGSIYHWDLKKQ